MKTPNFITNNLLIKVTSLNTLLIFIRECFSVITQKVLAVLVGAEGIALTGNLKNVFNFLEQFSVLGTVNWLIKCVSEFKNDKRKWDDLFPTSIAFTIIAGFLSFVFLFFWADSLNDFVFGAGIRYTFFFKILAFIVPCMGVNAFLNALLNGVSAYKIYSKVTIATIVITTFLIVSLTFINNVRGAMLGVVLTPFVQFIIFLVFWSKSYVLDIKRPFKLSYKKELLSYSVAGLLVIILINLVDIVIRNLIEKNVNVQSAGYWAFDFYTENLYAFTTAIFPLYVLPKYSEITSTYQFRQEVVNIYRLLLPLFMIGLALIYLFKNFIVRILYTNDFLKMTSLFKWQLLGDLMKFIALVIAYQFLAKRKIWYFVLIELLSVVLFYIFSVCLIKTYGTEGVVMAHFFRYVIYFLVVLYILKFSFVGENRAF